MFAKIHFSFPPQERANMKSRRVPCGRRSSVRAMIELGEVRRRASCVGVLEEFGKEELPKGENFRRGRSKSSVNERTTCGVGEVRERKSNVAVLGGLSNTFGGEFEEEGDDIGEDLRMIQNWEDQREKSSFAQGIVMEEFKDI